jgi:hypothetical protein
LVGLADKSAREAAGAAASLIHTPGDGVRYGRRAQGATGPNAAAIRALVPEFSNFVIYVVSG